MMFAKEHTSELERLALVGFESIPFTCFSSSQQGYRALNIDATRYHYARVSLLVSVGGYWWVDTVQNNLARCVFMFLLG